MDFNFDGGVEDKGGESKGVSETLFPEYYRIYTNMLRVTNLFKNS